MKKFCRGGGTIINSLSEVPLKIKELSANSGSVKYAEGTCNIPLKGNTVDYAPKDLKIDMNIDFVPKKIYVCATELTEVKENARLVVYYRYSNSAPYERINIKIIKYVFANKILNITINSRKTLPGVIKKWIAIG